MTVAALSAPKPHVATPGPYRISVAKYYDWVRRGALTPEDRVELIEGQLVTKMPQNTPHRATLDRLDFRLKRLAPSGWWVSEQKPITLDDSSPEPDIAVVRGDEWSFDDRHPEPSDFGIVIEVADSSLWYDRTVKGRLYAEAGIPEYWVVNIEEQILEVYTSPTPTANPPAYATRTDYAVGQSVPLVLDGVAVAQLPVADYLPRTA